MKINPYLYPGIRFSNNIKKKFMEEIGKSNDVTLDQILNVISKEFEVSKIQILSKNRKREIVEARHVFCSIMVKQKGKTSVSVGKMLSGRDHSTIIHSVKTAENLYTTDEIFRLKFNRINDKLSKFNLLHFE